MKKGHSCELSSVKKGHRIEISSDEEGLRGALFPGTVVRKVDNGNGFLVEYRDLMTEDGKSKLRETVQANLVRPEPPALNRQCFFLSEEVDAYDHDGWWRGVVNGVLPHNRYVVYFSMTKENCEYSIQELRLHQDWINGKWVRASENVEIKESNLESPPFSTENMEHICSKSARRSANSIKKRSVAKVLKLLGECKADDQCGTLQAGDSQLTRKSCKRKQGTKDLSNNDSVCKRKISSEKNAEVTKVQDEETLPKSDAKRKQETKDLSDNDSACKRKISSEKDAEVTEVQDEETLPKSDVMGVKEDLAINLGSPAKLETITISIPYLEYVDQNICSPCNTPGLRGKATLKQTQLLAYHSVLEALYLQNNLDWKHQILLTDLRDVLQISSKEHAKELRCITSRQQS